MFSFCRDQKEKGKKYGLIILDPPKFTHSKSGISQAIRGYININSLAMDLLEENGILVSCSCSGRVSLQQFENALLSAGLKSHKHIKILDIKIQNKDHPVLLTCQETLYLKCFVLSCSNIRE